MPSIYKIYRITCSAQYIERFESYKAQIERRTGYSDANCIRSWHGTVRGCRVGDRDDGTALCPPSRCSLCSIIEDSYGASSESSGERRHAWGRFGTGIYTTCTSSKAFDSAKEKGGSDYTALLLNEVTMGEPYYSERNLDDLKKVGLTVLYVGSSAHSTTTAPFRLRLRRRSAWA
ncbi:hypothetical protein PsYK624_119540 [Phanerochaete sordida]|uniref:PARP catalytic domain-containing protein n=1 Tax=Phanerochaete sordida TaxID=48140 RepID=A0A9P3GHL6_9APHY|nr:hypothetical protein PsYK624_119540 [Phanerochaete sordida]